MLTSSSYELPVVSITVFSSTNLGFHTFSTLSSNSALAVLNSSSAASLASSAASNLSRSAVDIRLRPSLLDKISDTTSLFASRVSSRDCTSVASSPICLAISLYSSTAAICSATIPSTMFPCSLAAVYFPVNLLKVSCTSSSNVPSLKDFTASLTTRFTKVLPNASLPLSPDAAAATVFCMTAVIVPRVPSVMLSIAFSGVQSPSPT